MKVDEKLGRYRNHIATCDWLVGIVRSLPDEEFRFIPLGGVGREKKRIVDILNADTSFKLLSQLESDIALDLAHTVTWDATASDVLSAAYRVLWSDWSSKFFSEDLDRFVRYLRFEDHLDIIRKTLSVPEDPLARSCSYLKARYGSFRH